MKTLLLLLALLATTFGPHALAADPPVTVSIDPEEAGQVIYAPMGALNSDLAPTGRLWFESRIQNNGGVQLTLTSIRVTMTGLDVSIPRSLPCDPGLTGDSLAHEEIITVPHPAPATVTFRYYFSGNPTPKTIVRSLVPYVPATPNGQYLYPADEGDLGPNEYFSDSQAHGPGSQMWGADWKVYRVVAQGTSSVDHDAVIRAGGDYAVNADHLGWGIPIRAIADGVVLRTSTGWINNPTAGTRAMQKMAEYDGETIADVKVTRLSATRAASLQRLPSGQIQLSIWDTADVGRVITRLGSSPLEAGEIVTDMALNAFSSTKVFAALRLSTDQLRLVVWDVSADGATVSRSGLGNSTDVLEVSLMKMSNNRFATGTRTAAGDLRVDVWEVTGAIVHSIAHDTAGPASSIATTALSATRVAISLRSDDGALKVIVWDYDGTSVLARRGDATAENISRVVAAPNAGGKWVTAMRTSPGGLLKLARWSASEDGMTVTPELVTAAHAIQNAPLAASIATGNSGAIHVVTASIIAGSAFKINGWGDPEVLPSTYESSSQNTAGAVSNVSIDELDGLEFFSGVRTTGGALKIMTWHWASGGGNSVIMMHGNCRVLYAHFQEGSVDTSVLYPGATVAAGQILGRMGNSGSSGAPHTHINANRLEDGHTLEEYIAADALYGQTGNSSSLLLDGERPMPFSGARAMKLSDILPGGEGNAANSFATLTNEGMYDIPLGIRPRLNTRYVDRLATALQPTGRKEPLQTLPVIGGPFPQVIPALGVVPSGGRLYIRGGSYDETMTFSTRMTVRRYDFFDAEGSVIIGK